MVQSDIERMNKKYRKLGQYITNLERRGKQHRARRLCKEQVQIDKAISDFNLQ
mgnify:CR=1 FL=1